MAFLSQSAKTARTLICCPFVPFIVVFSNVIVTGDEADLQLLDRIISSLQSAAQQSPSIAKLHHLCSTYHRVGRAYFNSTYQASKRALGEGHSGIQNSVEVNQTDTPFNSMGDVFLPGGTWDGLFDQWNPGLGEENALEVSSFLGNYFTGSHEF